MFNFIRMKVATRESPTKKKNVGLFDLIAIKSSADDIEYLQKLVNKYFFMNIENKL